MPKRTDIKELQLSKKEEKDRACWQLYKEQKGRCCACGVVFELRNLTLDHIIPQKKGGGDYYENLQLLYGHCNSIKGERPMEYLRTKIETREKMLNQQVFFGE